MSSPLLGPLVKLDSSSVRIDLGILQNPISFGKSPFVKDKRKFVDYI